MKKRIIILTIILALIAAFFIPVNQHKEFVIKSSFYNVYQKLAKAKNWERWRNDIRRSLNTDSGKILTKTDSTGFALKDGSLQIQVKIVDGYSFDVQERYNGAKKEYYYTVLPEKFPDKTTIIVSRRNNLIGYVINLFSANSWSETHIGDFKNFMENPDLYYGHKIYKVKVTDTCIVVIRRRVLSRNKFIEAAEMLNEIKRYIKKNGLKETQPLIAQFFPRINDSTQVNIGIPVNKKAPTEDSILYMTMPSTAYLYAADFKGRFTGRQKAFREIYQYFSDRGMQIPILPFDTYLDNKLPVSDTSVIDIRINFPTF